MATRMPPVPPANHNAHDAAVHKDDAEEAKVTGHDKTQRNLKEQGHQGNIAQNTRNQGFRHDPGAGAK